MKLSKYKDWSNAGYEVECLGYRLDNARAALSRTKKGTWACQHWRMVVDNLQERWKMTVKLKDCGLRQIRKEEQDNVGYDWWERPTEIRMLRIWPLTTFEERGMEERIQAGLQASWENRRNEIVQKARQGLV